MENLQPAFQWAISQNAGHTSETWKFYYGTWLARRGENGESIEILSTNRHGVSKALLSRLLKIKGDNAGALKALEAIEEPWLQLHPQIIRPHFIPH